MVNTLSEKCLICGEKRHSQYYDGKPYCKKHYDEQLFSEFYSLYNQWTMPDEPNTRLRYLMGRIIDEYFKFEGSYLSAARVRVRGYNFEKVDDQSFTFEIERHPGAFKSDGADFDTIEEKWLVDMSSHHAKVIQDTRNYEKSFDVSIEDITSDEMMKYTVNFHVRKLDDGMFEINEFCSKMNKIASNFDDAKTIVDDLVNNTNFDEYFEENEDKTILSSKEKLIEIYRKKVFDLFEDAWTYMEE